MSVITLEKYTTYFTLKAPYQECLPKEGIDLHPLLNILKIPIFDNQGKYQGSFRYYRYFKDAFHLPINFLTRTKAYLEKHGAQVEIVENKPNRVGKLDPPIKMKEGWTDREEHAEAFKHLTTYPLHMVGNNLQTGKGKSYVGVKLTTIFNCPTLVVCDGLVEQWVDNYKEKTDIDPDRIYVLQGINSLRRLWEMIKHKEPLPQVLVVSLKTLTRYSRYKDDNYRKFPRINDCMKALKIGYAIFDEIHLNTRAIVMLLLALNINRNVFLSATPERSDKDEQKIFEIIFPKGLIGGASKYDRYVDTVIRGYDLDTHIPDAKFETYGYGYSHTRYESKVLSSAPLLDTFQDVVEHAIRYDYLNYRIEGKTKCLVFVSTVRMAQELAARFSKIFPKVDIRSYTADSPIDDLYDAEIVISTPKSCGTGKDIRGLITVINTVSMSSNPGLQQMFGRLRKIDDGKIQCRFIDLINTTVGQQMRHFWAKNKVFKNCSKSFTLDNITPYRGKTDDGSWRIKSHRHVGFRRAA